LLSGVPEVDALVQAVTVAAAGAGFELTQRIAAQYPGDPGIAIALMLNHVTLLAGEALWLPAGNIHAYLRGTGIELMGPSDNVLRGGLTPKHVDRAELQAVLDFTPGSPSRLAPIPLSANTVAYRPARVPSGAGVDFELLLVTGNATVTTGSPAIAVVVDGAFVLSSDGDGRRLERGDIAFVMRSGEVRASGHGRLFVATGTTQ
jgi:mannose-6-phosphate isomerase